MVKVIVYYLLIINIISFLLYGIDKWKAQHNRWRVPEWFLIFLALIGGSVGALCGMYILRHKTQHVKFYILVPLILILQVIGFIYLFWLPSQMS